MTVTPDAAEAAARAIASVTEVGDDYWRQCATAALAAAAPRIAQQTLLDAARALPMDCYDPRHMAEFLTARAATLTPKDTP